MMLHGVDVSSYQGLPDWHRAKAAGVVFAACKATEGAAYKDLTFSHNWNGMHDAGIRRIAYHFLRPSQSGVQQADECHAVIHGAGGARKNDAVMLDVETTDNLPVSRTLLQSADFIQRMHDKYKRQVIIYTGRYFWQSLGGAAHPIYTRCPLWVAAWQSRVPDTIPGWPLVSFWQYSERGLVDGIDAAVDLDLFLGTRKQLDMVLQFRP